MKVLTQVWAVTAMSIGTLPQRFGTSLVVVAGTAGVVAVLVSILALASGLQQTLYATGRAERTIVVYRGAQSEVGSNMPRAMTQAVLDLPGITRGADGRPLATADVFSSIWLPRIGNPTPGSVSLRGISPETLAVRPEITLVEGRMFEPGLMEVIVGIGLLGRYAGLESGATLADADNEWTIVGTFSSGGSAHQSEIWSDAESVLAAYNRNSFNSVTAWTGDAAGFARLRDAVSSDPALTVDVHLESAYYAEQSGEFSIFLTLMARFIAGIMAVGAVFGALNSMYTAVSARTGEIATLRALGFGPACVVISVFAEALLLALCGALVGASLAWLAFNGNTVSTVSGNGIAQVAFDLQIGADALLTGIYWGLALGTIGGLFPAIRAARLPVVVALRGA
jgi:putative ABC transport system permease protein